MSGLLPVAVYGLKVHPGDDLTPALQDFPATFRLTMAAIDPSAEPNDNGSARSDQLPRATLKLFYNRGGPSDDDESDEDDDEEENFLKALLQDQASEDVESSSDDEELNGGPSDPSKSRKARKQAAAAQIMTAFGDHDSEDEMDINGINGSPKIKNKGKGKALSADDEESSDEGSGDEDRMEEVVVCTLDPQKNYQQPLDLTIGEDQRPFFKVSGTHTIYLTGNYVVPTDAGHKHDDYENDSDLDYDLSPDEDELNGDEESDELDDLEDPRITEVDTDEEEPPKLVKNDPATQKGKNKRGAEDLDQEPANLDKIIEKSLKEEPTVNGEQKLSKKQLKKLKNNAGKAVGTKTENQNGKVQGSEHKETLSTKSDKKVQFAKNLEQGPSGAPKESKADAKSGATEPKAGAKEPNTAIKGENKVNGESVKASLGPKTLQGGVKIDDRTLGKGPACKNGNKVGMRYIGKLVDGKVFDANKKGPPFKFTLGSGQVIKGWDIGVAGMSVGGERRIEIPANLGYGSKSMPGIPANSTLKFDVKLLEIS